MKRTRTPGRVAYAQYQKQFPGITRRWEHLDASDKAKFGAIGQAVLTEYFDINLSAGGATLDTAKQSNKKSNKTQNTKSK